MGVRLEEWILASEGVIAGGGEGGAGPCMGRQSACSVHRERQESASRRDSSFEAIASPSFSSTTGLLISLGEEISLAL